MNLKRCGRLSVGRASCQMSRRLFSPGRDEHLSSSSNKLRRRQSEGVGRGDWESTDLTVSRVTKHGEAKGALGM